MCNVTLYNDAMSRGLLDGATSNALAKDSSTSRPRGNLPIHSPSNRCHSFAQL